ncbi:MAG: fructose-1,6-bisphosphatase [Fusobacteriaceae bacterium]
MESRLKYLSLLAKSFPTIGKTSTEIINLGAILNLPKGTEHYITDIHGEYEAFNHVLKNCSGVIREKINIIFKDTIEEIEKKQLATVIYYPEEKIEHISEKVKDMDNWYRVTMERMLVILRVVASKYTSSKVRKALPEDFSYIIQELLYEREGEPNKEAYVKEIIDTIIKIDRGKQFIIAVSSLIQQLTIDTLHIVGDIYDRGPAPHKIVDKLIKYHNVDIQWGNHDILWMGAGSGQLGCIANVVRICTRYGNTDILEDGYGINILPLATFAIETYKDDPCTEFMPKINTKSKEKNLLVMSKIHKAISIIQFKLEGAIIKRNKDFFMEDRLLLNNIDYKNATIKLNGESYKLKDNFFPTINPKNPYELSHEEKEVIGELERSFLNSEKLQLHTQFLYSKGSIYLKINSNLLYHGCIPLNEKGDFKEIELSEGILKGRDFLDYCDRVAREGYFNNKNIMAQDFLWYLWCGKESPLFGKNKMKTFERYFLNEKETHKEKANYYYTFSNEEKTARKIVEEFELNPEISHIINGHVPVKVKKGEKPIKAGGKLLIIDGGFSKAYQSKTGIAGYTLIYNSHGMRLISHEPFENTKKSILECLDIYSTTEVVETKDVRIRVKDTDIGKELQEQIDDLVSLLECYRLGILKEKIKK